MYNLCVYVKFPGEVIGGIEMEFELSVKKMTLREQISFLTGKDFWHTASVDRLAVPSVMVSDGPTGLRKMNGLGTIKAICFPSAAAIAAQSACRSCWAPASASNVLRSAAETSSTTRKTRSWPVRWQRTTSTASSPKASARPSNTSHATARKTSVTRRIPSSTREHSGKSISAALRSLSNRRSPGPS